MDKTIAIECALPKEAALFFELPGEAPATECGIAWAVRELDGMRLAVAVAGMGTINAAATAQFLIDRFAPDTLIFSGIAGSLNPRIGRGDVVVGKRLECLESDMAIIAECAPYLESFPSDGDLVQAAEAELDSRRFEHAASLREAGADGHVSAFGTLEAHAPRYTIGTIATSDLFSTAPEDLEEVRRRYTADCEEMEGAAAAQICARCGVPFLAIRSISNVCGEAYEALDSRQADLIATARLAAEIVLGVAKRTAT